MCVPASGNLMGSHGGTENFRHAGIWQEPFSV